MEFRPFDKKLYYEIQEDLNAKLAFEKMTGGRREWTHQYSFFG